MKRILDACCGSIMFWFDKQNPDVEFVDVREFDDVQNVLWTHHADMIAARVQKG